MSGVPQREGTSSDRQAPPPAKEHSCKGVSLTFALQPHLILRISLPRKQASGCSLPCWGLMRVPEACCPLLAVLVGMVQGDAVSCPNLALLCTPSPIVSPLGLLPPSFALDSAEPCPREHVACDIYYFYITECSSHLNYISLSLSVCA